MADELKAQGNAAFSAGNFEEAIKHFSAAIEVDGSNHVLYSNRSAAQASLHSYEEALEDAKKCVELKPEWAKGYSRLGAAHHGLEEWDSAIAAYESGLKLDANSEQMKNALEEAKAAMDKPAPSMFSNPQIMAKLAMDPRSRAFLGQPDFQTMMNDLQNNPSNMGRYLQDPRFQVVLQVAFGLDMGGGAGGGGRPGFPGAGGFPGGAGGFPGGAMDDMEEDSATPDVGDAPPRASQPPPPPPPPPVPEEPMELDEEALAAAAKAKAKVEALKEKEAGNAAYKKKDFTTAVQHYNRALELYDGDISFLTNRAAVYFEMGEFEKVVTDCDAAVERGRELRADYTLVGKALQRKGNALVKLDRLDDAVAVYHKSLTEHRNADTLKRLNDTEKLVKERKEAAYIDVDISNVEREKGNAAFKGAQYPEAVQHYTEALKRGPPAVNPEAHKLYSNLAACYTKLGAWSDGLKEAERCIALAPDFSRGYSRKGALQVLMKDFEKAAETYQMGLKLEPDSDEMRDGLQRAVEQLTRVMKGDVSAEELKERRAKAMNDPEVQAIMRDPVMQQVLKDFEENPRAAQHHLKNTEIFRKINKLVAAGIIQTR